MASVLLSLLPAVGALLLGPPPIVARSSSYSPPREARRASLVLLADAPSADEAFSCADEFEKCVVTMPIGDETQSRDIAFALQKNVLTLGIKGAPLIIDEQELWGRALADDAFWEIDEVGGTRCVVLELRKRDTGKWEHLLKSQYSPPDTTTTVRTFVDVDVDGDAAGRIEFGLYEKQTPKTVENFRCLCTGEKGDEALHFMGSPFHRIIPGFMLQGGDTTRGDGTGGQSIYGDKFADEDFGVKHARAGLLSMANSGPDSNGSQFFITVAPTPWLDGKHVVFGEVTAGMDVVQAIERLGNEDGQPSKQVTITACGMLP